MEYNKIDETRRIFLGGTCNETTWRDELIEYIDNMENDNITYFNPVVDDWTEYCIKIEDDEKNNKCNEHLYVITPEMSGVYSIAEIINSVYQACLYVSPYDIAGYEPSSVEHVVFAVYGDFDKGQNKSLEACQKMCHDIESQFGYDNDYIVHTLDIQNVKELLDYI